MVLIVFMSFFIFICSHNRISVFDRLQFLETKLHKECLLALPQHAHSLSELKALVCGENFQQLSTSQYYVASGLIHLFVVSGAHLILLKVILEFIVTKILFYLKESHQKLLILSLLFFYAAVCEFNAPVVRAFVIVSLSYLNLFWPPHFKTLSAGLFCLILEPSWVFSLSLQLSWLIALASGAFNLFFKGKNNFWKQCFLTFWIYPTLLFFQTPNPFSIFLNFSLSWFLELVLFPFSLLVFFFHFLTPAFDQLIRLLNLMLLHSEISLVPSSLEKNPLLLSLNWFLILGLHVVCHLYSQRRGQKYAD